MFVIWKEEIDTIPARLEINLCSHAVDAIGIEHVVLFWYIVILIYTMKTHPVGHRPSAKILECVSGMPRELCPKITNR
jgi:hypothetical protein